MAAVQFFGTKDVVEAYNDRGILCWGIVESRKLLNAGDDADTLTKYLDRLSRSGTAATYTLQFYRDCDDPESITPKTECSSSFNFKLTESSHIAGVGMQAAAGGGVVQKKLNDYMEKVVGEVIEERLSGKPEKPEKPSFEDTLMGLLQEPEKLIGLINSVKGFLTPQPAIGMPVRMGATTEVRRAGAAQPAQAAPPAVWDSEKEMEKLYNAVQRLVIVDPGIISTIEKLADMAEKSPEKYKMAKMML
jgi:hypothetical protein